MIGPIRAICCGLHPAYSVRWCAPMRRAAWLCTSPPTLRACFNTRDTWTCSLSANGSCDIWNGCAPPTPAAYFALRALRIAAQGIACRSSEDESGELQEVAKRLWPFRWPVEQSATPTANHAPLASPAEPSMDFLF